MKNKIKFSFIIPTLNEEKHIENCIKSIIRQKNEDDIEILLVDNGSKDNTISLANNYNVKIIKNLSGNVGALRNYGVTKTKGEIICFIDADCVLDQGWLLVVENYIDKLLSGNIGIFGSDYTVPQNSNTLQNAWQSHVRKNYTGEIDFVPAGNMIISRKIYEKYGGFREDITSGEDYELCVRYKRLYMTVYTDSRLICYHYGNPDTIYKFIKREYWHGKGMIVDFKYPFKSLPLLISTIYFCAITAISLILVMYSIGIDYLFFIRYILFIMLIPLIVHALKRSIINRSIKYFPLLFLLYIIYSLTRTASLIYIIYHKYFRLKNVKV